LNVEKGGARARRALGTRERAQLSTAVRAALAAQRWRGGEGGGDATLQALPWLAAVDVDIVAREALRLELQVGGSVPPGCTLAISRRWQDRMEAAARQLDRHGNAGAGSPGAGVALVLDLVAGDWRDFLPGNSKPRSLGAFAVCLRREARRWRRHGRARKARARA
jgi:hypothetical protein